MRASDRVQAVDIDHPGACRRGLEVLSTGEMTMKGQSWSDKRKRGAILFHTTNPACADPPGGIPKSREPLLKADRRADAFLIVGRAYNEPQTSSHVEDILLERDFIID